MDSKRKVSQVFDNNLQGSRLRGRPKNRWWNCVQTGKYELRPAVKKLYQLRPEVSASCVSGASRVVNANMTSCIPRLVRNCISCIERDGCTKCPTNGRVLHTIIVVYFIHNYTHTYRIVGWYRQHSCYIIWYIFSCNWVDTRWQQYSSHLHTSSTSNTKNGTYITITKLNKHNNKNLTNLWSAGRAPSLRVIPWHLPYNWGKSTEKPQFG